jgi:hypothetical protein
LNTGLPVIGGNKIKAAFSKHFSGVKNETEKDKLSKTLNIFGRKQSSLSNQDENVESYDVSPKNNNEPLELS